MNTNGIVLFACLVLMLHDADAGILSTLKDKGRFLQVSAKATVDIATSWGKCSKMKQNTDQITDKVVLITGANSGIGFETALALAKRGGIIYLGCRDVVKAGKAKNIIIEQSGNNKVIVLEKPLDLASFASISAFVNEFQENEKIRLPSVTPKLHILINNAGVMALKKRYETTDGLEMQIGTNHFGHFYLTTLLLDTMKASGGARIVTVSSVAHIMGKIDKGDLQLTKKYEAWKAYGQSKLANILFTKKLADILKGTDVTANCLNPGIVDTSLYKHMGVFAKPLTLFMKTPATGALTSIMLAVDKSIRTSGKYYADCEETSTSKAAQEMKDAEWLWGESEHIKGKITEKLKQQTD